MNLEKTLKKYRKREEEIFDYFGYVEDWVVIPLDERTDMLWFLREDSVVYAKTMEDFITGECYINSIYRQRFLPKHIYEAEDYTMVSVDTHTDGNKFLQIFKNSLRVQEPEGMEY